MEERVDSGEFERWYAVTRSHKKGGEKEDGAHGHKRFWSIFLFITKKKNNKLYALNTLYFVSIKDSPEQKWLFKQPKTYIL